MSLMMRTLAINLIQISNLFEVKTNKTVRKLLSAQSIV